jgi:hypothetical protein
MVTQYPNTRKCNAVRNQRLLRCDVLVLQHMVKCHNDNGYLVAESLAEIDVSPTTPLDAEVHKKFGTKLWIRVVWRFQLQNLCKNVDGA